MASLSSLISCGESEGMYRTSKTHRIWDNANQKTSAYYLSYFFFGTVIFGPSLKRVSWLPIQSEVVGLKVTLYLYIFFFHSWFLMVGIAAESGFRFYFHSMIIYYC